MHDIPGQAVQAAKDVLYYANPNDVERALTAALPFLPVQGAVKKLEWELVSGDHYAEGAGTHYNIYETKPGLWNSVTVKPGNVRLATNVGLEAAKAAAQADYEVRILSALEPSAARELALEALRSAEQFIENGFEFGFIRKPDEGDPALETLPKIKAAIRALSSPNHADDLAVDRFAIAMKQKLAKKREEGRGGWENKDECSAEYLSYSLIQHIWKGDPVDVANFAMMLHQRGERVVIDSETSFIIPNHADAGKVEGDGWLPIDSAPKDGTEIIYLTKYGSIGFCRYAVDDINDWFGWWDLQADDEVYPKRWVPRSTLPSDPASEGAE